MKVTSPRVVAPMSSGIRSPAAPSQSPSMKGFFSVLHLTVKSYNIFFSCCHFQFNFVGRILGPRGMTTKQLEQETGCKIMVRGKGSMRDKKKVLNQSL